MYNDEIAIVDIPQQNPNYNEVTTAKKNLAIFRYTFIVPK